LRDSSRNTLVNCGARLPAAPGDAGCKKLGRRHHLDDDEARHTLCQFGNDGTRSVGDNMLPVFECGPQTGGQAVAQTMRIPGDQKISKRVTAREVLLRGRLMIFAGRTHRARNHSPGKHISAG
jgi:hypothetical protein